MNTRELSTVLAALRHFQNSFEHTSDMKSAFPDHFDEESALNHEEIDALCEELNTGEESEPPNLPPCYPAKGIRVTKTDDPPTLIASGYDWECPGCGEFNNVPSIPKGGKLVGCRKCGRYYEPFDHTDAYEG